MGNLGLIPPAQAAERRTNRSTNQGASDFNLKSESIATMAYLSIPGFAAIIAERGSAFADELNQRIGTLAAEKPCGWILGKL